METIDFQFIGNRAVVERLRAKLDSGRLPHALIFSGPQGVGKGTCARWIAQTLNCTAADPMACLRCRTCLRIAAGTFPDVETVTLRDDASQIKIEQIRDLRAGLALEPLEGRAMVRIIDPAETLTPSAANALLKSLEEPPPAVYFFLIVVNAQELLATIRSRSQTYHFLPLTLDEVRRSGITDELTLRWSEGSFGRALAVDPGELRRGRDQMLGFLERALGESPSAFAQLVSASAELARDKESYPDRLRTLAVLIRDLLFAKEGLDQRQINIDVRERIQLLADGVQLAHLVQIAEALKFIEINLKYNLNRQLMTDSLVLSTHPRSREILDDKLSQYR